MGTWASVCERISSWSDAEFRVILGSICLPSGFKLSVSRTTATNLKWGKRVMEVLKMKKEHCQFWKNLHHKMIYFLSQKT